MKSEYGDLGPDTERARLGLGGVGQLPLVLDCQQDDCGCAMRVEHDMLADDELAQIG